MHSRSNSLNGLPTVMHPLGCETSSEQSAWPRNCGSSGLYCVPVNWAIAASAERAYDRDRSSALWRMRSAWMWTTPPTCAAEGSRLRHDVNGPQFFDGRHQSTELDGVTIPSAPLPCIASVCSPIGVFNGGKV